MKILRHLFNLCCFSTAFGMTMYWLHKFWKDEDLIQMNLKPFEISSKGEYPVLSFCLKDKIFIESKMKQNNFTFTEQEYKQIWTGEKPYDGIEKVDFKDVTVNLKDYYLRDAILFRNGSLIEGTYANFLNKLPSVTFAGFQSSSFIKCFSLKSEYTNIIANFFGFNSSIFLNDLQRISSNFLVVFHLPNQISTPGNSFKSSWLKRDAKKEYEMIFTIQELEIMKRRSKRSNPCFSEELNFDEIVLNEHLEEIGCRAPFQTTKQNLSICNSKAKLNYANPFMGGKRASKTPCTTAMKISFKFAEQDTVSKGSDWFHMQIFYPYQYKEIIQVKAVDIQTAIGNAGGYIGLFLGKVAIKSEKIQT